MAANNVGKLDPFRCALQCIFLADELEITVWEQHNTDDHGASCVERRIALSEKN